MILVLVVAMAGGSIMYVQAGKITTTYRTAVVTYGTITQTIGMAGNLAPVTEADLNFPASGTVQSVPAQVGETVVAGETLATLDSTLLAAQLLQAQATLSSAQSKLSQDEAGPATSSRVSAQNQVSSAQVGVNNAKTRLADTKAINAQSVTAAQNTVNSDQAVLAADQQVETADCPASPNCAQDTAKVAADQQTLTRDQSTLASTKVKAQQSNDQAAASLASANQELSAARSSLSALIASTSPQTVHMDQAQIQIDQVDVNTLQHEVNGARMTSPIGGVVSQVNIKVGQSVSGSGSTYAIVVYTPGSYEVTGTVSDSQVNLVAVGQTAQVTAAGSTQALLGKISRHLAGGDHHVGRSDLRRDRAAERHQQLDQARNLCDGEHRREPGRPRAHCADQRRSHERTGSTVQVLVNSAPQSVSVQTGASDPTRTEIVSGLNLGEVVVIAVVTSAVPSSGTGTALGGRTGGGGGTIRGGGG